jgi:hypothetical protein
MALRQLSRSSTSMPSATQCQPIASSCRALEREEGLVLLGVGLGLGPQRQPDGAEASFVLAARHHAQPEHCDVEALGAREIADFHGQVVDTESEGGRGHCGRS